MATLRRALRYMVPYWRWQIAALGCALIVTISDFSWPYLNKTLVDRIYWPQAGTHVQRLTVLYQMALILTVALMTGTVFGLIRSYLFAQTGERAAADLRQHLYRHLHGLPMPYFDHRQTGGIMSVVQNDVEALQGLYSSTLVDIVSNLLLATVAIGLLFWYNPRLTLIGLPVLIPFAAALVRFGFRLREAGRSVREETGHVQAVLQETIAGAREVRVFARQETVQRRFMEQVNRLVRARIRQTMLGATNGSVSNLIASLGMIFVIFVGTRQVILGQMSAGDMVFFGNVLGMLFGPTRAFLGLYTQVAGALGAADRIFEFLDQQVEDERPDAKALGRVEGYVRFEGVCFRYEAVGRDVLHEIDLEVKPGQIVALVGPSGCGKTTLVSLLTRLYDISAGRLTIDNIDVSAATIASLRTNIAVVPQEPFLFGTSVAENIGFGRELATREEIVNAAKTANAHDFITALPNGYDTPLGERGTRLSVGQKQRIAIARAILRDPRILILDEATSALDSESERLVQEAIGRLMPGRTSFVIAHRLGTVQRADQIVVLEEGRIVEIGVHAELLARGSLYARLHALQLRSEAATADDTPVHAS